ncbi:MAG: response regulator [Pirellulaceae bacterium]|nr:response regulator [Pirellulaceae bacterium]
MLNILFVDDELMLLSGLRRMLHPLRDKWDMDFVDSGEEAIKRMSQKPYDVLVTDMRMSGVDGLQLLNHAQKEHPNVIRIVLSGHAEEEAILQAVGPAHQYLSKPCDSDTLRDTVNRAWMLKEQLEDSALAEVVSQMKSLPVLPNLYRRVVEMLNEPDVSFEELGEVISQDVAMTVKILQLVNSSFFGLSHRVTDVGHAVSLLGLNLIKSLILSVGIFSQQELGKEYEEWLQTLTMHSLRTGVMARSIAKYEGKKAQFVDDVMLAGMLHDVGKLVFAAGFREEYYDVIELTKTNSRPLWQLELELFGVTHGDVGGYLLALWGLPSAVVEAVAFHHEPLRSSAIGTSPVAIVHIVDVLANQKDPLQNDVGFMNLDSRFLKKNGLFTRVEEWKNIDFCLSDAGIFLGGKAGE